MNPPTIVYKATVAQVAGLALPSEHKSQISEKISSPTGKTISIACSGCPATLAGVRMKSSFASGSLFLRRC
jgi:hypothetical protein